MRTLESDPNMLEPDKFELEVAATNGIIPQCPFCGRWPIITTRLNENTGIYGARIICDAFNCGATLHANSRNRADARSIAIEKWSKRI
jgi:hypothetical protein